MRKYLLLFILPFALALSSVKVAASTITVSGTALVAVPTTYGTASANTTFTVSGTSISGGITATAPAGYEVSLSAGSGFGSSVTVSGTGTISATTIYVRIAAATIPGTYSGNVVCTSSGAANVNKATVASVVSKKVLTLSSPAASTKVYDRTTAATVTGTLTGIVGSDVVTLSGSGTFASASVGTSIAVTSNSTLSGANAGNYTLTQPVGLTANITAKSLTITGVTADDKTYDRTTVATLSGTPALSGVISPDVVTVGGSPTAAFASFNVGSGIAVTVSGYTLGGTSNYTLTQPTGLTASITAATLTVSGATASNKVYNGNTAATVAGGVLTGIISPDAVSVSTSGTFASSSVGTGVTVTLNLTGTNAGNYTLTQPGTTANITVKTITETGAVASNKVYDGTTTATVSGGLLTGVVSPDVVSVSTTGTFATSPVGTGITVTLALTGAAAGNYTLTQPGLTANITAKGLTITGITANNKTYDRTTAATLAGTATLSGVISPDVVTVSGSPTATFASANVASGIAVTVSGYTLGGANAANYTLTQPAGLTASITAATLTVSGAVASNKVYDKTTTATITGGSLTGVFSPDVVSISTTGTFATSNVGTGIVVSLALTGANAGNYTLTQPGITANITARAITITGLTTGSKVYDGTTVATISGSATFSGVLSGDVVTLGGSPIGTFATANVGTGIVVTVSGYTVTGADGGNYTLSQPAGFTANITAATLTVAATGPTKTAGTALTAGSYTTNFIFYGTVGGETITSVTLTPDAAGLSASTTAGTAYTVTPSAAVGSGGFATSNYSITYVVYNGVCAGHSYTWTGASSTTWSTSGNWSPSTGSPSSTDNVVIPASTTRAPTITTSTTVNTVTFTGNNTLTINSAVNLTIGNGFSINSGVTANLAFVGSSTSTKVELNSALLANYGTFNVSGTGLIQDDNNGSYIYNTGTFTANGNTTLYLQGGSNVTHALTNDGVFYAGTSSSNCNIEVDDYGSIDNSGSFYLGPTSLLYYYNDNAQYVIINNQSGGTFTLQSNANGSASIGEIPQGKNNAFTGTFNVERYYQGSPTYSINRWIERNYRIISSPVNTGTLVNGNYVFGLNYIVGSTAGQTTTANSATNAFITGCTGCSTSSGNPSIYLYNESYTPSNATYTSGNFLGISNITNSTTGGTITASDGSNYSLPVGTGLFFYFRGAATNWATRTVYPFIAPDNVTLTQTGKMNVGPYTFKDWYTPTNSTLAYTGSGSGTNSVVRGFNMIGNPYPCAIDWLTAYSGTGMTKTNIGNTIWVFNPVTSQYNTYLATSSTTGTATGTASRYIASGQGFVVQATAASPALTINEYAKVVLNNNAVVGTGAVPALAQLTGTSLMMSTTPVQNVVEQSMRLKLVMDSINYDDIVIGFNSSTSSNFNANEDAQYIPSTAPEGLSSISSDNVQLSINYLPLPKQTQQEVKLFVTAKASGPYTFKSSDLQGIPKIYDIWLMDSYLKDSLDIKNNDTYAFSIDLRDTNSYGQNRFKVVIRQNPALSLHLLDFAAAKATNGAEIVWKTENEENYTNFTVERSSDGGVTFNVLGGYASSTLGTYSFLDKAPPVAADQYRLKLEDINGTITYSKIVTLMYANANSVVKNTISLYPNPASSTLNLTIIPTFTTNQAPANGQNSTYNIRIVNALGAVVKTATSNQQDWKTDVSSFAPGNYVIQVFSNTDSSLVGNGSFIKL